MYSSMNACSIPLGMADTDFWVPSAKQDRFAANYKNVDGGLQVMADES